MKKVLGILTVMTTFVTGYAFAGPNVVSDSFTGSMVEECVIVIDGVESSVAPVVTAPGQARCEFNVGGVSEGTHTIAMHTKNLWGVSEQVPFDFTKELPPGLSGIRLEE